jgi:hypothetical protein
MKEKKIACGRSANPIYSGSKVVCIQEPYTLSGIFLKKMPPSTIPIRLQILWNRSKNTLGALSPGCFPEAAAPMWL